MNKSRAFIYVQHLLGIGHLKRAVILAQATVAAGLEVTLASGGLPVADLVRELLLDGNRRSRMSDAAVSFAAGERSIDSATIRLGGLLARFAATPA